MRSPLITVYKSKCLPGNLVTGDSAFSMFNLSLREDWVNNKKFCHRLSDDEEEDDEVNGVTQKAEDRLAANKSRQSSPNHASQQPILGNTSTDV